MKLTWLSLWKLKSLWRLTWLSLWKRSYYYQSRRYILYPRSHPETQISSVLQLWFPNNWPNSWLNSLCFAGDNLTASAVLKTCAFCCPAFFCFASSHSVYPDTTEFVDEGESNGGELAGVLISRHHNHNRLIDWLVQRETCTGKREKRPLVALREECPCKGKNYARVTNIENGQYVSNLLLSACHHMFGKGTGQDFFLNMCKISSCPH